ncbi:glutathione peroxidase [Planctomycetes bacterium Poly30]
MTLPEIPSESVYALSMNTLGGEPVDLSKYAGKVTVFVNVASKCGYTPQYADLQKLSEELGGEDFALVGIPSNDFGGQEPGTAEEIQAFCSENYGVTFDMLEKVGTKEGDSAIFDALATMTGKRPGWNFCKYVVSKDGTSALFFESKAKPTGPELRGAIDKMASL